MHMAKWWIGLVAGIALVGCAENGEVSWPGQQASPQAQADGTASDAEVADVGPQSEPNVALANQYLGNALVSAARAHSAVMQGNARAARNDIWAIRRQLRLAGQWATIDQQRELNRLEGQVIELEAQLVAEEGTPQSQSAELLRAFIASYDTMVAGEGGGAGVGGQQEPPATGEGLVQ